MKKAYGRAGEISEKNICGLSISIIEASTIDFPRASEEKVIKTIPREGLREVKKIIVIAENKQKEEFFACFLDKKDKVDDAINELCELLSSLS